MQTRRSVTLAAQLETDEQSAHRIADSLSAAFESEDLAVSLFDAEGGRWRVAVHCGASLDRERLRVAIAAAAGRKAAAALRFERVAERDWVRESFAGLTPVVAGRFTVHGAHHRGRIPANRIGIEIEAALAFGTGHHATTRGCLLALDRICKTTMKRQPEISRRPEAAAITAFTRAFDARWRPSRGDGRRRHPSSRALGAHLRMTRLRILDLGTGSGVLAIAAARALRQRVLATDIDAGAVRVAHGNAALNRAGAMIDVLRADGVAARGIRAKAPFDLIFANILLAPLQRFAAPLCKLAAPGARVVLSGLLSSQVSAALAAYRGLALERRITLDGWTTLVLVRRQ